MRLFHRSAFALTVIALSVSTKLQAQTLVYIDEPDVGWVSPYLSYEANDKGQITTLGAVFQPDAHFQLAVGLASYYSDKYPPGSTYRPELEFLNLDTSVRFGTFDRISLYGEVGVALDELIFDEEERDYYDRWGGHYEKMGPVDWFAGVGAGGAGPMGPWPARRWSVVCWCGTQPEVLNPGHSFSDGQHT